MAALDASDLPTDEEFRAAVRSHVEFGSKVAMQNSHAETDDQLHPLREVPRWTWPGDEEERVRQGNLPISHLDERRPEPTQSALRYDFAPWTQDRFGPIDLDRFHREELPALLRRRGDIFSPSDAAVVRPLGFQLSDGRAYTYVPDGTSFSVEAGYGCGAHGLELDPDAWCAFVWELKTCSRSSMPTS